MVDREAAVTPVVGVILLLAIVIILAALVASFAPTQLASVESKS